MEFLGKLLYQKWIIRTSKFVLEFICIVFLLESPLILLQARDIYEEAIASVTTVRDFTQIFDAYSQFEELTLSNRIEQMNECACPSQDGNLSSYSLS